MQFGTRTDISFSRCFLQMTVIVIVTVIAWPVRFVMEVKHSLECFSSRYIGDATTHLRPGSANAVLIQTLNFT